MRQESSVWYIVPVSNDHVSPHPPPFFFLKKSICLKMLVFLQGSFIDSLCIYTYNYDSPDNTWNKFWSNDSDLELQKKNHFLNSKIDINIELLEKAMAAHSSTLAWKIPWTEEPGRLQSMGSVRVRHDWVTSLSLFTFMHWRRKWQPTPVFLPGESQGWGSLVGCCLWGHTESDTTKVT